MDLSEALYTTRAMRRLRPDPIPLDVQARILDAAVRAPNIDQQWRFLFIDDRETMARLAELYRQAWARMFELFGMNLDEMVQSDSAHGRAARSGTYLATHFQDIPLLLIGFSRTSDGSSIYPALWNAMLAARAEGVGSAMTTILHSFRSDEVCEVLGVPRDEGWQMHGAIPMGYPKGRWGLAVRRPAHEVAARNRWDGDLGFTVPEPLWQPSPVAGAIPG